MMSRSRTLVPTLVSNNIPTFKSLSRDGVFTYELTTEASKFLLFIWQGSFEGQVELTKYDQGLVWREKDIISRHFDHYFEDYLNPTEAEWVAFCLEHDLIY